MGVQNVLIAGIDNMNKKNKEKNRPQKSIAEILTTEPAFAKYVYIAISVTIGLPSMFNSIIYYWLSGELNWLAIILMILITIFCILLSYQIFYPKLKEIIERERSL